MAIRLFDYYAVPQNSKIRRQIALLKKRGADGDYPSSIQQSPVLFGYIHTKGKTQIVKVWK